ncbi:hypothetical protein BDR26DRAFT_865570 [Obelidium mucronatum]|nr:hypothetical protein BDR26DRAFT_865570 [Obelidium mucronatum]
MAPPPTPSDTSALPYSPPPVEASKEAAGVSRSKTFSLFAGRQRKSTPSLASNSTSLTAASNATSSAIGAGAGAGPRSIVGGADFANQERKLKLFRGVKSMFAVSSKRRTEKKEKEDPKLDQGTVNLALQNKVESETTIAPAPIHAISPHKLPKTSNNPLTNTTEMNISSSDHNSSSLRSSLRSPSSQPRIADFTSSSTTLNDLDDEESSDESGFAESMDHVPIVATVKKASALKSQSPLPGSPGFVSPSPPPSAQTAVPSDSSATLVKPKPKTSLFRRWSFNSKDRPQKGPSNLTFFGKHKPQQQLQQQPPQPEPLPPIINAPQSAKKNKRLSLDINQLNINVKPSTPQPSTSASFFSSQKTTSLSRSPFPTTPRTSSELQRINIEAETAHLSWMASNGNQTAQQILQLQQQSEMLKKQLRRQTVELDGIVESPGSSFDDSERGSSSSSGTLKKAIVYGSMNRRINNTMVTTSRSAPNLASLDQRSSTGNYYCGCVACCWGHRSVGVGDVGGTLYSQQQQLYQQQQQQQQQQAATARAGIRSGPKSKHVEEAQHNNRSHRSTRKPDLSLPPTDSSDRLRRSSSEMLPKLCCIIQCMVQNLIIILVITGWQQSLRRGPKTFIFRFKVLPQCENRPMVNLNEKSPKHDRKEDDDAVRTQKVPPTARYAQHQMTPIFPGDAPYQPDQQQQQQQHQQYQQQPYFFPFSPMMAPPPPALPPPMFQFPQYGHHQQQPNMYARNNTPTSSPPPPPLPINSLAKRKSALFELNGSGGASSPSPNSSVSSASTASTPSTTLDSSESSKLMNRQQRHHHHHHRRQRRQSAPAVVASPPLGPSATPFMQQQQQQQQQAQQFAYAQMVMFHQQQQQYYMRASGSSPVLHPAMQQSMVQHQGGGGVSRNNQQALYPPQMYYGYGQQQQQYASPPLPPPGPSQYPLPQFQNISLQHQQLQQQQQLQLLQQQQTQASQFNSMLFAAGSAGPNGYQLHYQQQQLSKQPLVPLVQKVQVTFADSEMSSASTLESSNPES